MTKGIATVVLREQRGKLTIQGLGQTARGQKYIKEAVEVEAKDMHSKNFKEALSEAVEKLLA